MNNIIKLALVDDEQLFRNGIHLLSKNIIGLEVKYEFRNGLELIDFLESNIEVPDIVLMDLNMPGLDGIETSKRIIEYHSDIKIIILSTYFSKSFVIHMLEMGVASYLPKDSSPELFETTIREVFKNGFYYYDKIQEIIKSNFLNPIKTNKISIEVQLTKRELEILTLICNQFTNGEIAKKLFLSPRTVEGHRRNLLSKLNCKNTAGLVAYAIQHKLIKIDPRY